MSLAAEQSDMSVSQSKIDTNPGTFGVVDEWPPLSTGTVEFARLLQKGYRRFKDSDIRCSDVMTGELSAGTLNGLLQFLRSDGDGGFDETSVNVLLSEVEVSVLVDEAIAATSLGNGKKGDLGEERMITLSTITKDENKKD